MTNLERRMERFDEFFLFITSVLGLFFSLLYALLAYRQIVYGFLPLIIIGVVIPIYIGYVRGAILLDSLEERVRGWIYFLYGVIFYLAFTVLFITNKLLLILNVEFEPFSGLVFFAGTLLLGFFLGGRRLYRWFCRNIFKAFNYEMTELMYKIYDDTSSSAFLITIFLYVSFAVSQTETFDLFGVFTLIYFSSFVVFFFVFSERDVRKWVNLIRFSDFIEIKHKKTTSRLSPRVGRISILVSIISILIVSVLRKWLPLLVNVGLMMIFIFGLLLSGISTTIEHIPVKKKDVPKDIETELTKLIDRITKKKTID